VKFDNYLGNAEPIVAADEAIDTQPHLSTHRGDPQVSGTAGRIVPMRKLVEAEPYCSCCPQCSLADPGWNHSDCKACQGRGWLTRAAFESCPEAYRRQALAQ
jgi:hypothetical protein